MYIKQDVLLTHFSPSIGFIMDPDAKPTSLHKCKKGVSPLKPKILPSCKERKLVRDRKIGRIGNITLVDKDDKGDVTAMKIHWEGEEKPIWLMFYGL